MCWIKFEINQPYNFQYKDSFDELEFKKVECSTRTRKSTRISLRLLYQTNKGILKKKFYDLTLLFTCKPPAMNQDYLNFFSNLAKKKEDNDI